MSQIAWVDVANAAILKTGSQTIVNLSQTSTEARLCNTRLPLVVAMVLRRYPWKSAMKTYALTALVAAPPDPAWGFIYPLPPDLLRIWNYVPGSPLAGINYGSNYVLRSGQLYSNDGVIVTTNPDGTTSTSGSSPILQYVYNPYLADGPGNLDALLIEAIACKLALDICYQITQSLPLKQELAQEYKAALQTAKSVDSMETPEVYSWQASEFLTARYAGTGYMGPNNPGFPTAP